MLQGDVVYLTGRGGFAAYIYLDHVEYLDRKKKPAWGYLYRSLDRIENTAAGALPESVWTHGSNIPLNVTKFDGVLSDKDSNIQRAIETLDDHTHPGGVVPALHAATHRDSGTDEIGYVTPGVFRLPKANALGNLDDWIRDATEAIKGKVELATSAETTAGLAVQASDTRLSDARTPTAHAASHAPGASDAIGSLVSDAAYGAGWDGSHRCCPLQKCRI